MLLSSVKEREISRRFSKNFSHVRMKILLCFCQKLILGLTKVECGAKGKEKRKRGTFKRTGKQWRHEE